VHIFGNDSNKSKYQEEIERRLNSGNACYLLIQSLMTSCLLHENGENSIYNIIVLLVVLYGCETWSLILWEGHGLRVFETRVLRRGMK
jgi:hypothetical protein